MRPLIGYVAAASMVADAFTARDDGGVETKMTEVGCGVSPKVGRLPDPPHAVSPAIVPMATKDKTALQSIMTFTPYSYCSKTHRKAIQPQEVVEPVVELTN